MRWKSPEMHVICERGCGRRSGVIKKNKTTGKSQGFCIQTCTFRKINSWSWHCRGNFILPSSSTCSICRSISTNTSILPHAINLHVMDLYSLALNFVATLHSEHCFASSVLVHCCLGVSFFHTSAYRETIRADFLEPDYLQHYDKLVIRSSRRHL